MNAGNNLQKNLSNTAVPPAPTFAGRLERYATPLPKLTERVVGLDAHVSRHLEKMGFAWK